MGNISERADRFVDKMMKQHQRGMGPMEEHPKKMVGLYERLRRRRKQMQKQMGRSYHGPA